MTKRTQRRQQKLPGRNAAPAAQHRQIERQQHPRPPGEREAGQVQAEWRRAQHGHRHADRLHRRHPFEDSGHLGAKKRRVDAIE